MTSAALLQYGSALAAFVAAALWFRSAVIAMPTFRRAEVLSATEDRVTVVMPAADPQARQIRWNASAALFAELAALLQGIATFASPPS